MLVIVDQHSSDNRESVESLESKVAADHVSGSVGSSVS